MKNQLTRNMLVNSIKMDDELYHHGVLGMSWGDRNGPPYPLSGSAKKIARAEAKKKIEREKRLEKARKIAADKRKEEVKAAKKQEKIDKKKIKMLKKGDMKRIYRNRKLFTNEELQFAIDRNNAMIEQKHAPNIKKAPDPHMGDKLLNVVTKLGMAAQAVEPLLRVSKGMAELRKLDRDAEIRELNLRDDQIKYRYDLLKQANPKQAVQFLNKMWGTNYTYDSLKDNMDILSSLSKQYENRHKADENDPMLKTIADEMYSITQKMQN